MYKNLLIAIVIAIFAGCSAPKPEQVPSWYTNPPKDYKNFYAVASASSETKAKKIALNSLRVNLNKELDTLFKTSNNKLLPNQERLQEIIKSNAHLCKKLPMRNFKIEKTQLFKQETLILISVPREKIFKKLQLMSDNKIQKLQKEYNKNRDNIAIKRFVQIKPLMDQYAPLASMSACKDITISTYSSNNDFNILKDLNDEYESLKSKINFYILSDGNSRRYTKSIKEAITQNGLSISRKMKDSNTLKLLITSKTTDSQEYTFMKSSNLVKFTTFDANKNKIAFRQHTFVGKSRKSHKEAAQQAAIYLKAKVKKLGIFALLGIQNK